MAGAKVPAMHISIQGIDLHFDDRGASAPLVLLHGLTGVGDDFRHAFDMAALRARYRVIAPDLRGHGRTANPSGQFSFRQCADDVLALMDALGIERFSAVGTSLGAKTMLHVATLAPDRVEAMVLVSAAPHFPDATRALMRAAASAPLTDAVRDEMRSRHLHGDAQIEALWQLPARFASDRTDMSFTADRLAAITARTLLVHGDRDPLYPVELAVELHRGVRGSSLWVVPSAGHVPIYGDARAEFERLAVAFLAA